MTQTVTGAAVQSFARYLDCPHPHALEASPDGIRKVDPGICGRNFPLAPADRGGPRAARTIGFGVPMTDDDVRLVLRLHSLQPATIRQLYCFGAHHPREQAAPIIALGSVLEDPSGLRRVGCLYRQGLSTYLALRPLAEVWTDEVVFLGIVPSRIAARPR